MSAKMSAKINRKYGATGENLRKALQRAGVNSPGSVATYLLFQFTENSARIKKENAVGEKNMPLYDDSKSNGFDLWREDLKQKGFLDYFLHSSNKYMIYRCGKKLVKYVNKIKETEELITRSDLDTEIALVSSSTDQKINRLTKDIEDLYRAMEYIIDIIDPPSNKHKVSELAKGPKGKYGKQEILKLVASRNSKIDLPTFQI